jgi:hypothetical protein
MNLRALLIVTAFVEVGAGLFLLSLPAVPFNLLFGLKQVAPETLLVGRVAGAALLAIGIASWQARNDNRAPAQLGLLMALVIYNLAATSLLTFSGTILKMAGMALWPAILLHAVLAVWCIACLKKSKEIA